LKGGINAVELVWSLVANLLNEKEMGSSKGAGMVNIWATVSG